MMSYGNTLDSFGKKRKSIAKKIHLMRWLPEGKENLWGELQMKKYPMRKLERKKNNKKQQRNLLQPNM
jgi:hypothetical protein